MKTIAKILSILKKNEKETRNNNVSKFNSLIKNVIDFVEELALSFDSNARKCLKDKEVFSIITLGSNPKGHCSVIISCEDNYFRASCLDKESDYTYTYMFTDKDGNITKGYNNCLNKMRKLILNLCDNMEVTSMTKKFNYNGKIVTANSKQEAIKKVVAFRDDEANKLIECLKLLEKQVDICGNHFYFELDKEKEVVNVYLNKEKKNVYLTVNVGSDSPASAIYDIWKVIHSKI